MVLYPTTVLIASNITLFHMLILLISARICLLYEYMHAYTLRIVFSTLETPDLENRMYCEWKRDKNRMRSTSINTVVWC